MAFDASWSNVVLALRADGTHGATTVPDLSPVGRTMTSVNGASISTTQSKFGGSSMSIVGASNQYFSTPISSDFAFPGDFTIEFFAWKSANGPSGFDSALTTDTSSGSAVNGWIVELSSSRGFCFLEAGAVKASSVATINDSTWHHWAACRSGTTLRLFRDGTQIASATYATSVPALGVFGIGRNAVHGGNPFSGYMDDLRITKGAARYTASFTAPAAPIAIPTIAGNVKDDAGANAARTIRAYVRATGVLGGSTVSDATTGNYELLMKSYDESTVLALDDVAGTAYNALILDRVTPS